MLRFHKASYLLFLFNFVLSARLTLFRMSLFRAAHGWGGQKGTLSLKSVTHPTLMKPGAVIPYMKKIQNIHKSRDTPLSSADMSIFSPKICYF